MSSHKVVQSRLRGYGWIARKRSGAVSTDPLFHCVHYELLSRDTQKLALLRQPFELRRADHDLQPCRGAVRLFRRRSRISCSHGLDRGRAANWMQPNFGVQASRICVTNRPKEVMKRAPLPSNRVRAARRARPPAEELELALGFYPAESRSARENPTDRTSR